MEVFDFRDLNPIDFFDEEKTRMEKLLEKMEKMSLTNEEYRYLQYLLMKYEFLFESNYSYLPPYPLCQIGVTSDKIMFISDTHRGFRAIEDKNLIDLAYNEALRQNIKAVVHAGDFIEACSAEYDKKLEVVLKELETAISDLPNEIVTGLLLGNHDYSAIRTYRQTIPYFFSSPKIEVLGMQKVLLYWNGQTIIRINHPISQLKEPEEKIQREIITLEGHHHRYSFNEDLRTINLPSLSRGTTNYSLFVIGENQGDTLLFYNYCIGENFKGQLKVSEIVEVNTKTKQLKLHS